MIETQACLTPDPRGPSTTPSMHGDTASPFTSSAQPCSGNKDRDVIAGMGAHRVGVGLSLQWLISGCGQMVAKKGKVWSTCVPWMEDDAGLGQVCYLSLHMVLTALPWPHP